MAKINNFNNGFIKKPSKRDIEALNKKRLEEEKELIEKMNIPERDENKYPMPDDKEIKEAAGFLYTMSSLASSYDKNLQALIWSYYIDLMYALRANSKQDELFSLIDSLTKLKEYLATSNNPLFTPPANK